MTSEQGKVPAQLADANLIDITGPIRINYARSSFAGSPQLSYHDAELDLKFEGKEIVRVDTPIGELVTVTVQDAVDAFTRRISLLVPVVRLARGDAAEVETVVVETVDRSLAFVPAPGPAGALQSYRIHQVRGSAQVVDF
jgi:hypothetical protein